MSEIKEYRCKNLGCTSDFKWPMQLARHSIKCLKPVREKEEKSYYLRDEVYVCRPCEKTFNHQPNIIRHVKGCNGVKEKKSFQCNKCQKTFSYQCRLEAHMKNHVNRCDRCNKRFRKVDLFNEHRVHCVGSNNNIDIQFIPSFTAVNDHSLNIIEEQLPLMTIQPDDQNVSLNDRIVPSNDLLLDSSEAIDSFEIPDQHVPHFSGQESSQSVPSLKSSSTQSSDRTSYWKNQKQIKRKSKTLEEVIQSLSEARSPLKNQLIQNVVQNHPKSIDPLLKQNENEVKFEKLKSDALLKQLKTLNKEKKFPKFHELLFWWSIDK